MNTPDRNQSTTKKRNKFGRKRQARYERYAAFPKSCSNCGFEYIGSLCPKCGRKRSEHILPPSNQNFDDKFQIVLSFVQDTSNSNEVDNLDPDNIFVRLTRINGPIRQGLTAKTIKIYQVKNWIKQAITQVKQDTEQ